MSPLHRRYHRPYRKNRRQKIISLLHKQILHNLTTNKKDHSRKLKYYCGLNYLLLLPFSFNLIIFKHNNVLNSAFENLAQIINLSCADPLIFPQSVNCRTADIVLVDKSVGALITFLQSFPKGSVFYH